MVLKYRGSSHHRSSWIHTLGTVLTKVSLNSFFLRSAKKTFLRNLHFLFAQTETSHLHPRSHMPKSMLVTNTCPHVWTCPGSLLHTEGIRPFIFQKGLVWGSRVLSHNTGNFCSVNE